MTSPADIARLRQGLYRFFGGALASPDEVRLGELAAAVDYLDTMADIASYAFYPEWRAFASEVQSGANLSDLGPEHVRLFSSGTKGVLCPPIESYYRAQGRREAIAEIVAAIERDYRYLEVRAGNSREPPDHAITQLEMMSTLCARESAAWQKQLVVDPGKLLDLEGLLLERHLAVWMPEWRALVHAARPKAFYAALIEAVHAFVIHDQDLIAALRRWAGAVV